MCVDIVVENKEAVATGQQQQVPQQKLLATKSMQLSVEVNNSTAMHDVLFVIFF